LNLFHTSNVKKILFINNDVFKSRVVEFDCGYCVSKKTKPLLSIDFIGVVEVAKLLNKIEDYNTC